MQQQIYKDMATLHCAAQLSLRGLSLILSSSESKKSGGTNTENRGETISVLYSYIPQKLGRRNNCREKFNTVTIAQNVKKILHFENMVYPIW